MCRQSGRTPLARGGKDNFKMASTQVFTMLGVGDDVDLARAELLADLLTRSLPAFRYRKIVVRQDQWQGATNTSLVVRQQSRQCHVHINRALHTALHLPLPPAHTESDDCHATAQSSRCPRCLRITTVSVAFPRVCSCRRCPQLSYAIVSLSGVTPAS